MLVDGGLQVDVKQAVVRRHAPMPGAVGVALGGGPHWLGVHWMHTQREHAQMVAALLTPTIFIFNYLPRLE